MREFLADARVDFSEMNEFDRYAGVERIRLVALAVVRRADLTGTAGFRLRQRNVGRELRLGLDGRGRFAAARQSIEFTAGIIKKSHFRNLYLHFSSKSDNT